MRNYPWPGNVRELQNVIERAVITSRLGAIHFDVGSRLRPRPPGKAAPVESAPPATPEILTEDEMKRRNRENIVGALRQAAGRIYGPGGAAEVLGMKPTTLNARIKKLNLTKFI